MISIHVGRCYCGRRRAVIISVQIIAPTASIHCSRGKCIFTNKVILLGPTSTVGQHPVYVLYNNSFRVSHSSHQVLKVVWISSNHIWLPQSLSLRRTNCGLFTLEGQLLTNYKLKMNKNWQQLHLSSFPPFRENIKELPLNRFVGLTILLSHNWSVYHTKESPSILF